MAEFNTTWFSDGDVKLILKSLKSPDPEKRQLAEIIKTQTFKLDELKRQTDHAKIEMDASGPTKKRRKGTK